MTRQSPDTIFKQDFIEGIAVAPWRIRTVTALPDYCLSVTCNDGTTGIVDMSQLISGKQAGIFAALKDEEIGKNKIWFASISE